MNEIVNVLKIPSISLNLSNNYLDLHREYKFESSDFEEFNFFFESIVDHPVSSFFSSNYT